MRRRAALAIVVASAAAIDLAVGWTSCSSPPRDADVAILRARAVPLDLDAPYAAGDYRFLDAAVGSASVVQLGESLHITAELPRVRLRFVQYLHEQLGFDTLALEGSLTQSWLAQDQLYHSTDPQRVDRAQRVAWFGLWDTPAMREVMAYVDATRATPSPLYLTSFDVQVGMSAAYAGEPRIVGDLLDALRAYAPPPHPDREAALRRGLETVVGCGRHAPNRDDAAWAIDELATWIAIADPHVRPASHAAALLMIPDNFRDNLELCAHAATWQESRDEAAARDVALLLGHVSATHRLIVWAHHSHVAYDSTGKNVASMGQHLRELLGRAVYTIGTFAGSGRVIDGSVFGERELPSIAKFGVERMLGAVGQRAYFVDASRLPTDDPAAGWLVEKNSRAETISPRATILAKDFDGAIYVARVHPSPISDSFAVVWLIRIWGFVIQHAIGVAFVIVAGVGFALRAIVRWLVRRIRRATA
jgi:erythromycin esterase-like protein